MQQLSSTAVQLVYLPDYTGIPLVDPQLQIHPDIQAVLDQPRVIPNTEEWLNQRKHIISGTDCASILNKNKYRSKSQLFKQKTGQIVLTVHSAACQWGIRHEDQAAQIFEALTGIVLITEQVGLCFHPKYNNIGATPDRLGRYVPCIIEIKCPYSRKISHTCPPEYYCQIQLQLQVCNLETAYLVQYKKGTISQPFEMDILRVERDPMWWHESLPQLLSFWDEVLNYYKKTGREVGSVTIDTSKKRKVLDLGEVEQSEEKKFCVADSVATKSIHQLNCIFMDEGTTSQEITPIEESVGPSSTATSSSSAGMEQDQVESLQSLKVHILVTSDIPLRTIVAAPVTVV